jgi:adenylylsulfate kinase
MKTNKIYWFTGQPNSGKTTLANELIKRYTNVNDYFFIDGDSLRNITKNYNYTKEGRCKNIQDAHAIASFLYTQKKDVIVAMVSPYIELREKFKNEYPVVEIYLTSNRTGKESYKINEFQTPMNNFLHIDTDKYSVEECINQIEKYSALFTNKDFNI